MKYEDTNILRTQYVNDLVNQRQIMENAMIYQESPVTSGEGLSTMVPKVSALTGTKPTIRYINFVGMTLNKDTLPVNINTIPAENVHNIFRGSGDGTVYLENAILSRISDFSHMFEGLSSSSRLSIYLGKNCLFTNAEDMSYMFYKRGNIYLYGLDNIPKHRAPKLKSIVHFSYIIDRTAALLYKIYDAPIEHLDGIINPYSTPATWNDSEIPKILNHIFDNWNCSNLKTVSNFSGYRTFTNIDDPAVILEVLHRIPTENLEDISDFIGEHYNRAGNQIGGLSFDWSDKVFHKLKKAYYMIRSTSFKYINLGTCDSPYLTNIQGLCACSDANNSSEAYTGAKIIDISGWDLSQVINVRDAIGKQKYIEELYFGTNLGKGFTQKTNNYSDYAITLPNCSLLTTLSVVYLFNRLYDLNITYDVANRGRLYTQKIDLHADVIAKLTPEEIAIATNKGWTVV